MKYIDLNGDLFRQTLVDQEDGQFLGQVSSAILEDDKTIVAVYPKGHGRGSVVEKISRDAGLTWSERIPLPESFVTSLEVPTVYRMTDAAGKKRLMLFSGNYPIRMAVSEDDGLTWSELKPMNDYGGICVMGDVFPLGEPGKYMAMFHDEVNALYGGDFSERKTFWRYTQGNQTKYMFQLQRRQEDGSFSPPEQIAFVDGNRNVPEENGQLIYETLAGHVDAGKLFHVNKIITRDGGLTWSQPQTVARHPSAHLCEPGVIRLNDGTLAILMRENSRKFNSFIMFSEDNGETFTKPRELPDCLTGDRHTCRRLRDGRIAVTFRDNRAGSETLGDWVLWVGTDEDLRSGGEGQYKFRLKKNYPNAGGGYGDCAYPGFHVLPDDTMVLITYGHWDEGKPAYVIAVRLNLRDIEKQGE